jgi:hypothetical protein
VDFPTFGSPTIPNFSIYGFEEEATTKHTKGTKGHRARIQPTIADPFLKGELSLATEIEARKLFPLELQFFVLFVPFVVASFTTYSDSFGRRL